MPIWMYYIVTEQVARAIPLTLATQLQVSAARHSRFGSSGEIAWVNGSESIHLGEAFTIEARVLFRSFNFVAQFGRQVQIVRQSEGVSFQCQCGRHSSHVV